MSQTHFDLLVLGTGPSGGTVATEMAAQGRRVAIVDSRAFGGTCALRGCNPKKVFTNAGALINQVRRSHGSLLGQTDVAIDWAILQRFKKEFTVPVLDDKESSFQRRGIATFRGPARFVDKNDQNCLHIDLNGRALSADRVVIATGAMPTPLDFANSDLICLSEDFLALESLPDRIVFIGGGYISMEFAHVATRAGASTTIVERDSRILSQFDPDLVAQLSDYSRQQGIDLRTDTQVCGVCHDECGNLLVNADDTTIRADLVVHGAGRVPNVRELNLAAADVDHNSDGIIVDRHLKSRSNPRVFACGDCAATGRPRLTPVANEQASVVVENLFVDSPKATLDSGPIAKVVFTSPPLASVGMSQEQAERECPRLSVRLEDTSTKGIVRKTGDSVAGHKILIDSETNQVVGAHLLGPTAEETINLFALAIRHHLTTADIRSTAFAYPTFGDTIRQMI